MKELSEHEFCSLTEEQIKEKLKISTLEEKVKRLLEFLKPNFNKQFLKNILLSNLTSEKMDKYCLELIKKEQKLTLSAHDLASEKYERKDEYH